MTLHGLLVLLEQKKNYPQSEKKCLYMLTVAVMAAGDVWLLLLCAFMAEQERGTCEKTVHVGKRKSGIK
jgi:hypothetical protein